MFTLELDVTSSEGCKELAAAHGGTVTDIKPNGPGGGNPCITIECDSREKADEVLTAFYGEEHDGLMNYTIRRSTGRRWKPGEMRGKNS